jgi:hypothetical protein
MGRVQRERLDLPTRPGPGSVALVRPVRDRLANVAVRVPDERTVTVGVVLGPQARRVEYLRPLRHRGVEERAHVSPVAGCTSQV